MYAVVMRIPTSWQSTHEFACHDVSCAPPPVGRGGSKAGSITPGGSVKLGERTIGRIKGNVITLTTEGLNGVRITGRNKDDALAQAVAKVQGGQNLFL
jgi:hypothetical protein